MNEKLTAYALNELTPDERAELEAQFLENPALKQQGDEMKTFCSMLNDQVGKKEGDFLTAEQRRQLTEAFAKPPAKAKIIRPMWRHPFFVSTTAVAACVAFALVRYADEARQMEVASTPQMSEKVKVGSPHLGENKASTPMEPSVTKQLSVPPPTARDQARREMLAEVNRSWEKKVPLSQLSTPVPGEQLPSSPSKNGDRHFADITPADRLPKDRALVASNDEQGGQVTRSWERVVPEMPISASTVAGTKPSPPPAPLMASSPAQREAGAAAVHVSPPVVGQAMPSARKTDLARAQQNSKKVIGPDAIFDTEDPVIRPQLEEISRERYAAIRENNFESVAQQPLSTFSIDVDTASYANVRRFLNNGQRPPGDAVRLEELINYFPYTYEAPSGEQPFGVLVGVTEAPWNPTHRLARIALKGREAPQQDNAANFVFLVDVSGSMNEPDKLPLVRQSLKMLVGQLRPTDRVSLVVYAGRSGVVLPSTVISEKETVLQAVEALTSGGSTNGASGIRLAYEQATQHFIKGGVNRVILCTDGDFNVGISSPDELEKLITEKAKSGVFLSVLGYGTGNLQDHTMETLADKGNGNYAYIDSLSEARKVLVEQMQSTLVTIAKDVKIQVEFNPAQVSSYRLLGYENRALAKEDFNNDRKDAGEIGAGHTVTALYEIVPSNVKLADGRPLVDDLKYGQRPVAVEAPAPVTAAAADPSSPEMMTVKLRYKKPDGEKSDLIEVPVLDKEKKFSESSRDFKFAASVAGFGMLLRDSSHSGELTWDMVRDLALQGKGEDALGYRGEFLQLIDKARGITEQLR